MAQFTFITLEAFKERVGVATVDVVTRKNAEGKTTVFGVHDKGTVKVQKDLNPKQPIRYMYEEG